MAYISFCLHTPSLRLRREVADLLGALCVISPIEGHQLVLAAFSDFRVEYKERFRFEWLITSLGPIDPDDQTQAAWEWRTSVLALPLALAGATDELELRCEVQGEVRGRGLNQAIEVSFRSRLVLLFNNADAASSQAARIVSQASGNLSRRL